VVLAACIVLAYTLKLVVDVTKYFRVNKRLEEKIAEKRREPYLSVMTYIIRTSSDLPF